MEATRRESSATGFRVRHCSEHGDALQPYKGRYLQQASRVRDTIAFHTKTAPHPPRFSECASRLRSVQVNYLNLVASYLNAASQYLARDVRLSMKRASLATMVAFSCR